jgi:outer membrane protein OmpA-like peptidoglycan-associated protein
MSEYGLARNLSQSRLPAQLCGNYAACGKHAVSPAFLLRSSTEALAELLHHLTSVGEDGLNLHRNLRSDWSEAIMTARITLGVLAASLTAMAVVAQAQAQTQNQGAPVISINVERTIQTVNYGSKGSTHIDFRGTALLPLAKGEARIEAKNGAIVVDCNFDNLSAPGQFGNAYLTYVLWAITPEGRANNLGELVLDGKKSKLEVTTRLQNFGLIVTAEPYFAVTAPSEDVILENIVRPDTKGQVAVVNAKYELLQRARYRDANLTPLSGPSDTLSLLEARNAMRIAHWRQADKYAQESWSKASDALNRAEDYEAHKQWKAAQATARDATQGFEDAITVSMKRQEEERLAQERQAAAEREAQARAAQEAEAQQRAAAETQRMQAELDAAREAAARAQADQQRSDAEKQKAEAEKAQADAEKAQAEAQAKEQQAQDAAAAAQASAAQAEQEKEQLRASLLEQFNRILETRDTARGLVVSLGDVLFATGKYDLRPDARERLAKLSGIVLAHPGLNLAIEGYTDNVGSELFNQTLSEQRASSVRAYLIAQGLNPETVSATGFGMSNPVADNSTAAGRQKNRRVEIVVSGEIIGTKIGSSRNNP